MFYTTFNKTNLYKILVNRSNKFDDSLFRNKWPVSLEFFRRKNLCLYFWVMLKPVLNFFKKKNVCETVIFSKFQKVVNS